MSGIEIAGLVLGAFPLAIEGIKAYSNGMRTIKDIKNYQQILRQFARDLSVEKCKFDNTLLELLRELVDAATIKQMMADLACDEWQDAHFQSQLKDGLRPADETLEIWLHVAKELGECLEIVTEKFKLPPPGKVHPPPPPILQLCTRSDVHLVEIWDQPDYEI